MQLCRPPCSNICIPGARNWRFSRGVPLLPLKTVPVADVAGWPGSPLFRPVPGGFWVTGHSISNRAGSSIVIGDWSGEISKPWPLCLVGGRMVTLPSEGCGRSRPRGEFADLVYFYYFANFWSVPDCSHRTDKSRMWGEQGKPERGMPPNHLRTSEEGQLKPVAHR